jgi:hypothetical protein
MVPPFFPFGADDSDDLSNPKTDPVILCLCPPNDVPEDSVAPHPLSWEDLSLNTKYNAEKAG